MSFFLILPILMLGLLAGIYVSVLIHDHRVEDLTAQQYVAMHQMREKTFALVMPPVIMLVVLLAFSGTSSLLASGWPTLLGAIAVTLLVFDIVLTIKNQVPLDKRIQSWTIDAVPREWRTVRDRWAAHHSMRCGLAVCSFACFVVASLGSTAAGQ